jgi:excisionase family DNA binding protein
MESRYNDEEKIQGETVMSQEEFLSIEDVATLLKLKEETIRQYIRNGDLQAYKFGHVLRVKRTELDEFIEKRRTRKDE